MKRYTLTLKHDGGRVTLHTVARDEETAITAIMAAEGCPRSAIVKVTCPKYIYMHVLQGDYLYGDGWEDLCQSEDRREMSADRKSYRENAPEFNYRIIRRRELNA